ncbi:MAG: transposase [Sumerlaeia bacterium]
MPRIARIVVPNHAHHIRQDSIDGKIIFENKDDYNLYLDKLEDSAEENKVEVIAYCLCPDRVHLILQPKNNEGLAKLIRQVHSFYSRAYNLDKGSTGPIWGERFASCPLENSVLDSVARYVERAGLPPKSRKKTENYEWNSAAAHCGTAKEPLVSNRWPFAIKQSEWSAYINESPTDEEVEAIEYHTRRGYAYGSATFQKRLEKKLGRTVIPTQVRIPKAKT